MLGSVLDVLYASLTSPTPSAAASTMVRISPVMRETRVATAMVPAARRIPRLAPGAPSRSSASSSVSSAGRGTGGRAVISWVSSATGTQRLRVAGSGGSGGGGRGRGRRRGGGGRGPAGGRRAGGLGARGGAADGPRVGGPRVDRCRVDRCRVDRCRVTVVAGRVRDGIEVCGVAERCRRGRRRSVGRRWQRTALGGGTGRGVVGAGG